MTTSVQRRRGSTTQHSTFTGLEGEITVDTTKDTAVVHDGSTVGGFPLAKEGLENTKTTNLTAIIGTDTAADDTFLIYDTSASLMKKITRAELNNAIEVDALSNVTITGGTINGTSVGATTRSSGAFTTLNSNSTTTLNGTTIPASKTLLVSTDIGSTVQAYDADLAAFAAKTAPTGVVVGTTDTQTLTNKTIDGVSNTLTNLSFANITEPVRHSVRPSLLLDFANTKTLDPRITFTRGSTGTYYDGKTTVKAEENLLQYSQEFDNAWWVKTETTVTANSTTAPDGTTAAELIVPNTNNANHNISKSSVVSLAPATLSVYAKASGYNYVILSANGGTGNTYISASFNLSAGTAASIAYGAGNTGSPAATSSIQSVGNGWYRCTLTISSFGDNITVGNFPRISVSSTGVADASSFGQQAFAGDGTSGIFLWGAQLEQRSSVTAYTPTTTAPITNYIPALQTAAAGVARFEHNPVTGESLGLEIEEQRTNLVTRSEEFDNNSIWTKTNGSITANTIVAPDGTLTGDLFIPNTSSGRHTAGAGATVVTATSYTMTVYAKAGIYSKLLLREDAATGSHASFDLSTGTVLLTGNATASIVAAGNGWYRCSATVTSSGTFFLMGISVLKPAYVSGNNVLESWSGNGFDGIFIWGAQLEAGAFATSYIPTVASQVTRSQESVEMTGANFSSWYSSQQGTLYAEASFLTAGYSSIAMIFNSSGITQSNQVLMATNAGQSYAEYGAIGGSIGLQTGTVTANTFFKSSIAFTNSNVALSANGGAAATNTTVPTVPIVNSLRFAHDSLNRRSVVLVKKLAYYPRRLTNAELQGLTTV